MKKIALIVFFTLLASTVSIPASLDKRSDSREEANALESFEDGWNRTFGGPDIDWGYFVQQTRDGGYIVVGVTSSEAEDTDVWLIKTDEYGNLEWDKIFFYSGGNLGYSIDQTTDEGYIITGDRDVRKGDAWLIKTDKHGNLEWEKTFGYENEDFGHSVQQTRDGGYIIGGRSSLKGYEAWLIKTDRYGNEEWNRTFDMPGDSICWEVQQTRDGGYILAGGAGVAALLIKTDRYGNEEWSRTFGGESWSDDWWSVRQTRDGGYIVAGDTNSYTVGGCNAWLIKTDEYGEEEWNRTFGGGSFDVFSCVRQTSDGGYIAVGLTASFNKYGANDIWLVKTDEHGNKMWGKIFGGGDFDRGECVQPTKDGGFIITGFTRSFGAGKEDVWLIKVMPHSKPPGSPSIEGPSNVKVNRLYEYTFSTVDPEGDDVYYFIIWGDGSYTPWIGPYKSGENVSIYHRWRSQGSFEIKAKAMDVNDFEGVWSDPFPVSVPNVRMLSLFFQKFFGIGAFLRFRDTPFVSTTAV